MIKLKFYQVLKIFSHIFFIWGGIFLGLKCVVSVANEGRTLELVKLAEEQTRAQVDGPNCHNYALVYAGVMNAIRYVGNGEMNFWLKESPICRELALDEVLEAGDLRVIRIWRREGRSQELWHTQVYVDGDTVLEKVGLTRFESYQIGRHEFVDESNIINTNGMEFVSGACNRSFGLNSECLKWVNYYRCRSFADFLSSINLNSQAPDVSKTLDALEIFSENIENMVFDVRGGIDYRLLEDAKDMLVEKKEILLQAEILYENNEEINFIIKALFQKITSLEQQIFFFFHPSRHPPAGW